MSRALTLQETPSNSVEIFKAVILDQQACGLHERYCALDCCPLHHFLYTDHQRLLIAREINFFVSSDECDGVFKRKERDEYVSPHVLHKAYFIKFYCEKVRKTFDGIHGPIYDLSWNEIPIGMPFVEDEASQESGVHTSPELDE